MAACTRSCRQAIPSRRSPTPIFPQTCGACHGQKFAMASGGMTAAAFNSYQESVHGKAVAAGSEKAAVCTDCHGEHDILSAGDPKSPINKFNVPATCAKCHANVKAEYMQSIHGTAITARQLAGAGLHRLPRHPHHQGAQGCELVGRRREREEHLRVLPRRRAPLERIRRARRPRQFLLGELSRHGIGGGLQHGGQLRQLPRRAQHSAVQRSALHHQSREPGQDLRPVPSRRERQVHHHQGSPRRDHARPTSAARSSA